MRKINITKMKLIISLLMISLFQFTLIANSNAEDTKLEDKKWVIESIQSNKGVIKGPHLGFIKFINGSIEGQSTCNIYKGVYALKKQQSIKIYRIGLTELQCKINNKMEIEARYTEGLETIKSYKFEDGKLILIKENNSELARFVLK